MRIEEQIRDLPESGYPPRRSWESVSRDLKRLWRPGEGQHFSVMGPTRSGKSHLVTHGLLPMRNLVFTLDVKGEDEPSIVDSGRKVSRFPSWLELERAELEESNLHFRIVPGGLGRARPVLVDAIRRSWVMSKDKRRRPLVLNIDETRVISDKLKMRDHLETLWIMGGGRGIEVVASTQAPRWVPHEFYDQASFHAIARFRDKEVLRRLREIAGADGDMLADVVPNLKAPPNGREFLILGPDDYAVITEFTAGRGKRGR